jgi:hypothetical protein
LPLDETIRFVTQVAQVFPIELVLNLGEVGIEGNESYASDEFPATSRLDGPCDILRKRDTIELSPGDIILIEPHDWPAFEPSQYVTIERPMKIWVRDVGRTFQCPEK